MLAFYIDVVMWKPLALASHWCICSRSLSLSLIWCLQSHWRYDRFCPALWSRKVTDVLSSSISYWYHLRFKLMTHHCALAVSIKERNALIYSDRDELRHKKIHSQPIACSLRLYSTYHMCRTIHSEWNRMQRLLLTWHVLYCIEAVNDIGLHM